MLEQFVNHEADDAFLPFGDHADAVALPEAAEEIFLGPGEFEALPFDVEDFRHIAADHPANLHIDFGGR